MKKSPFLALFLLLSLVMSVRASTSNQIDTFSYISETPSTILWDFVEGCTPDPDIGTKCMDLDVDGNDLHVFNESCLQVEPCTAGGSMVFEIKPDYFTDHSFFLGERARFRVNDPAAICLGAIPNDVLIHALRLGYVSITGFVEIQVREHVDCLTGIQIFRLSVAWTSTDGSLILSGTVKTIDRDEWMVMSISGLGSSQITVRLDTATSFTYTFSSNLGRSNGQVQGSMSFHWAIESFHDYARMDITAPPPPPTGGGGGCRCYPI